MKSKNLIAIVAFIVATASLNPLQAQREKSTLKGSLNVMNNSGERSVDYSEDGHRYKMKLSGSKITEMSVDGKEIPADGFSKYDGLVKTIITQIEKDEAQAREDRAQAKLDRDQAMKDRAQADKDREQALKDRAQADKDREQALKDREKALKDRDQELKDRAGVAKDRAQSDKDRERTIKDREQADRDRELAKKDRAQAEKDREQAAKDRKQAEEDRKYVEGLLNEIVQEKLVESREALTSMELDETKLTINGKEQSEAVHKRFRTKFLNEKHHRINFKRSNESTTISVN